MKASAPAFTKEVVRSVTGSWSRFLAIFAIVALGAGFYAGLRMTAPDMRLTADAYYDDTSFMDVRVVSTFGLSESDVEAVRALAGVSAVMPQKVADVTATIGAMRQTVRVHGLDIEALTADSPPASALNRPVLVAGRWPERTGECVLDKNAYSGAEQIGQQVVFTAGVTPLEDTFEQTEYTVVGIANSSYYLSFERGKTSLNDGTVDRFMFVPDSDFVDDGVYTDLFLTVRHAAAEPSFDPAYDAVVDPVKAALREVAPAREAARLAEVTAEAQRTLDEKRAEYEQGRADAEAEFAAARSELDAAAATIASSAAQLEAGRAEHDRGVAALAAQRAAFQEQTTAAQLAIDAGRAQIASQRTQLADLATALEIARGQIAQLSSQVATVQAAYNAARAAEALGQTPVPSSAELGVQLAGVQAQLTAAEQAYAPQQAAYESGMAAVAAGSAQLDASQAELDAGKAAAAAQFGAAQTALDAAARQLRTGATELAQGRQQLADGEVEYAAQKASVDAELADAARLLDEGQADIDAIKKPTWYVLGRTANTGYADLKGAADRMGAIAVVFPLIFFLVAALVALTTMTRMVDEERTLIGTYKALGYSRARIMNKYLLYAAAASVPASAVGILIGSQLFPKISWYAHTTMFTTPPLMAPVDGGLALLSGVASVGVTIGATLLAVAATLREGPAALMLPRAPKAGKRILLERVGPVWRRLSFLQKVTARNIFRYKKRLLMTVVGVAGCTALLLTGFGLKNSITDMLAIQYDEIYHFNTVVGVDPDTLGSDPVALTTTLDATDAFSAYLKAGIQNVRMTAEDAGTAESTHIDGYLRTPEDVSRVPEFINLRERTSGHALALEDSGALISEKAARRLGIGVGDTVRVAKLDAIGNPTDDPPVTLTVSGIAEQYLGHFLYISPRLYEQTYGEPPAYNEVLGVADVPDSTARERVMQSLLDAEGVTTVQYNADITESFGKLLESLNSIVLILIVSAALLAFIVLYNLTNINLIERRREVATIKVLGFYDSEVNAYIYRETVGLAIVGCAIGLLLGIALVRFVITTAEIDIAMFGRRIHALSYVWSAALTMLFAVMVNLVMQRRLRRIDMVESLKSVE